MGTRQVQTKGDLLTIRKKKINASHNLSVEGDRIWWNNGGCLIFSDLL